MKSFLMLGQSNMAGRGFLHEVAPIYNERIKMLRNGRWQMMTEPINYDRPVSGVGPAASFADAWIRDNPGEEIGLIPCAEGGSSLDEWHVQGTLFRHTISEVRFAMESSEICGILWHQGESDSYHSLYKSYYEKLYTIIETLRKELCLPAVPFLIGELGEYLGKSGFGKSAVEFQEINQQLFRFADEEPNCYFVTAKGLTPNPDGIHLNAISQRKFGYRYYRAFSQRQHVLEPLSDEDSLLERNDRYTKNERMYLHSMDLALGKITYDAFENEIKKMREDCF